VTARAVAHGLAERVDAVVAEVADLRRQLDIALERRDALMVEARQEGMSQSTIAGKFKVSQPHVMRILASAQARLALPV